MLTVNRIVGRGLLLGCLLVSLGAGRTVLAREPVITSNLGGLAISCSIHRDQAAVAGVTTGSTQSQVEEILGMPQSVQYGRGTMEYSYPSRTLLLVHFSPERPYVLTDLKTSKWGDGTPDRVQVGMGEMVLNDVYGQADAVWTHRYESPKIPEADNARNHARLDETVYVYHANKTTALSFKVREGVIRQIHIHQAE